MWQPLSSNGQTAKTELRAAYRQLTAHNARRAHMRAHTHRAADTHSCCGMQRQKPHLAAVAACSRRGVIEFTATLATSYCSEINAKTTTTTTRMKERSNNNNNESDHNIAASVRAISTKSATWSDCSPACLPACLSAGRPFEARSCSHALPQEKLSEHASHSHAGSFTHIQRKGMYVWAKHTCLHTLYLCRTLTLTLRCNAVGNHCLAYGVVLRARKVTN